MTITQRRIYYTCITIVFLGLAPLVFFMTSGYRFDPTQGVFVKTGLIIIDSSPTNATISVNNQATTLTTPRRLANLAPGTYTLSLTKDGYQPWHSTVLVHSNKSTIIGKPLLFLTEPVVSTIASGEQIKVWPNQTRSTFLIQPAEGTANLVTTDSISSPLTIGDLTDAQWSPNDEKVLTTTSARQFSIITIATNSVLPVPSLAGVIYDQLLWKDNNHVVALSGDRLYTIDLDSKTIILTAATGIAAVASVSNSVWVTTTEGALSLLDQTGDVRTSYTLPKSGYVFASGNQNTTIALRHPDRADIIVLANNQLVRIPLTFIPTSLQWNENVTALAVASETELWSVNRVNNFAPELLERTTDIGDITWFRSTHLAYRHGTDLKIIDTSPVRSHVPLLFWQGIAQPELVGTTKDGLLVITPDTTAGLRHVIVM